MRDQYRASANVRENCGGVCYDKMPGHRPVCAQIDREKETERDLSSRWVPYLQFLVLAPCVCTGSQRPYLPVALGDPPKSGNANISAMQRKVKTCEMGACYVFLLRSLYFTSLLPLGRFNLSRFLVGL